MDSKTNELKVFPQLTTERLILRELLHSDADDIHALRNDDSVNTYIQVPTERKKETGLDFVNRIQQEFLSNKGCNWIICLKTDPKLIGNICLWNFSDDLLTAELGYALFEPYRDKGIMSEAIVTVLDYGFNVKKFHAIEAYTHHQNRSSTTLLEKFGFEKDSSRKDEHDINNIIFVKHK